MIPVLRTTWTKILIQSSFRKTIFAKAVTTTTNKSAVESIFSTFVGLFLAICRIKSHNTVFPRKLLNVQIRLSLWTNNWHANNWQVLTDYDFSIIPLDWSIPYFIEISILSDHWWHLAPSHMLTSSSSTVPTRLSYLSGKTLLEKV